MSNDMTGMGRWCGLAQALALSSGIREAFVTPN